jgi:hypothetical protein
MKTRTFKDMRLGDAEPEDPYFRMREGAKIQSYNKAAMQGYRVYKPIEIIKCEAGYMCYVTCFVN